MCAAIGIADLLCLVQNDMPDAKAELTEDGRQDAGIDAAMAALHVELGSHLLCVFEATELDKTVKASLFDQSAMQVFKMLICTDQEVGFGFDNLICCKLAVED